jgi:hypothetical protein
MIRDEIRDVVLAGFFGEGNDLCFPADDDPGGRELGFWVDQLAVEDGVVVLPRKQGDTTVWYALGTRPETAEELRENLTAFVGASYASFDGRAVELDESDPVEASLMVLDPSAAFRFSAAVGSQAATRERLRLMLSLRRGRPRRRSRAVANTAQMLVDFRTACRSGEFSAADALLRQLDESGDVSSSNRLFLRVERFAAARDDVAVLAMRELPQLLELRRPRKVTEFLAAAVYRTHLLDLEEHADPKLAHERFLADVKPAYPGLFRVLGAIDEPSALKGFMLEAVTSPAPLETIRDRILEIFPADRPDRAYVEALSRIGFAPSPKDDSTVTQLLGQGAYEEALALLERESSSSNQIRAGMECAFEINTLDAATRALALFEVAPEAIQEDALSTRRARQDRQDLLDLAGSSDHQIPENWPAWFARLRERGAWDGAVQLAEQGADEWEWGELAESPSAVEQLVEALETNWEAAETLVLAQVLDRLVDFLIPDGQPHLAFVPAYRAATSRVVFLGEGRIAEARVLADLVDAQGALGMSADSTTELVEFVTEFWDQIESPTSLAWGVDMLDVLSRHPAADDTGLHEFATKVRNAFDRYPGRVKRADVLLVNQILAELGLEELRLDLPADAASEAVQLDWESALAGKLVGIYTLTERAGERAKQAIEELAPSAKVRLSCSKVADRALESLAKNADYMIVATRSAKHAATEFIRQQRGERTPLFPQGKGSSSMLRALEEHLGPS